MTEALMEAPMTTDGTTPGSTEGNLHEAALRLRAAGDLLEHAHLGQCDEAIAMAASDDLINQALRWAHGLKS